MDLVQELWHPLDLINDDPVGATRYGTWGYLASEPDRFVVQQAWATLVTDKITIDKQVNPQRTNTL